MRISGASCLGFRCCSALLLVVSLLLSSVGADAGEVVGWRTDGTGRYPDATPVLEWGPDRNVVWKTPMPEGGNATPVVVGERIFVCAEPATLICVDRADGKILWQRENTYDALYAGDGEEGERIRGTMRKAAEVNAQLDKVLARQQEIRRTVKKKGKSAELEAENARLDDRVAALREKLKSYEEYAVPKTQEVNGYSSATPVTDGSHVWMVFGTGVVVCYDMEGGLEWFARLEKPGHADYGFCASPVLAGGRLIVHFDHLWGLDPGTGEVAWKVKLPWAWGTPVPVKVGETEVIFTAKGNVVRASDGKVLSARLEQLEYNGATLDGNIIYYIQNIPAAYRIPDAFSEDLRVEELWKGEIEKDRYYACPLIHDGLVYDITQKQHLFVLDAATGETLYRRDLELGKGTAYQSITLGGDYIFIGAESGRTVVIKPGREYVQLAGNSLEPFRASPVFIGDKMYIRGLQNLYCIGK